MVELHAPAHSDSPSSSTALVAHSIPTSNGQGPSTNISELPVELLYMVAQEVATHGDRSVLIGCTRVASAWVDPFSTYALRDITIRGHSELVEFLVRVGNADPNTCRFRHVKRLVIEACDESVLRISAAIWRGKCFESPISIASACSATASVLAPGVYTTWMPRAVAAGTSTWS